MCVSVLGGGLLGIKLAGFTAWTRIVTQLNDVSLSAGCHRTKQKVSFDPDLLFPAQRIKKMCVCVRV